MGKIFTLTDDIKQIASDAIDDLIDQLGKDCRLIYPDKVSDCPNCIFNPVTQKSSNKYQSGGPFPFQDGTICPVCHGNGRLQSEQTETIKMLCSWNPRQWIILPGNINVPNSMVQTKGYLTDLPKVLRSRKMVLQIPIEPYNKYQFELQGEPIDQGNIIQGRYFIAVWKRSG
jgi:RNA polymerase subunit RPABC4/transcription elongation factor Spt4